MNIVVNNYLKTKCNIKLPAFHYYINNVNSIYAKMAKILSHLCPDCDYMTVYYYKRYREMCGKHF